MEDTKEVLLLWFIIFLDKKSLTQTGTTINSNSDSENQQLAKKLDESKLIF